MKSSTFTKSTFIISLLLIVALNQLVKSEIQGNDNNRSGSCDKSRNVLTQNHGFIENVASPSINYTQNTHCEWLINGSSPFISLIFHHMDTECGYDYVFVYDGLSMDGKKLFLYLL